MRRDDPYTPRRIDMGDDNHHPDESLTWEPPRGRHLPEVITGHFRRRMPKWLLVTLVVLGVPVGIILLVPVLGLLTTIIGSATAALGKLLMAIVDFVVQLVALLLTILFLGGIVLACGKRR